jgi:hypothetical protein
MIQAFNVIFEIAIFAGIMIALYVTVLVLEVIMEEKHRASIERDKDDARQ